MIKLTFKKVLLTSAILIAAGQVGIASAHDRNDSLGASASAVDYLQVTCATGTHHLFAQIDEVGTAANSRQFNVLVNKANLAASTTAPDTGTSPGISPAGSPGTGVYNVYISQTAGGAVAANYHLLYHCQDSTRTIHTGTTIAVKQDQ